MKFNWSDEDYLPRNICCIGVAVLGAAAVGAAATAYSANKAASVQKNATDQAAQVAQQQYRQTREDLSPFRETGGRAMTELEARMPHLTAPIELSQEWLESTPGYKFTRDQGLKATQNSVAARGLGVSGAALKGAATFATGLADNTYKTQFDAENTNRTNAYNRLMGLVTTGQNAAAQTGVLGEKAAYNTSQALIGGGNAQAAGINATGNAIGRLAGDVGGYAMYRGLYGSGNQLNFNSPDFPMAA